MLNFENLDSFVVDMRTNNDCDAILEDILCEDDVLCKTMKNAPIDVKRTYIIGYFTSTYKYIFTKRPQVLLVCEEKLYTQDDIQNMREIINKQKVDIRDLHNTISELNKLNNQLLEKVAEKDCKISDLMCDEHKRVLELTFTQHKINKIKEIVNG